MPNCPGCGKPVYFAEEVISHGKHWHHPCLKCAECSKDLTSGSFIEHDGYPYCFQPCYMERFGPSGHGHEGNDRNK